MSKKSKKLPLSFPGSESRRALLCFKNNSKEKYREEEAMLPIGINSMPGTRSDNITVIRSRCHACHLVSMLRRGIWMI